jgi:CheY-like chemotaxis protein
MIYDKGKAMVKKIMIVDDEPVVCDVLHDDLSERGYQCTTALNGNDALSKLAAQEFGAVLLDIRLPGMSAWRYYGRYG